MKTIFYLIAACAVVFTACQNDNSVNPRPTEEITGKVTITGRVKAELNSATAGLEPVTQPVKVIAEISTADLTLNPDGDVNYPSKYYEATVTGSGEYSVEVDAGPYETYVTLHFADFRADVTSGGTTTSKLFQGNSTGFYVIKNQNRIQDFNY